MTWSLPRSATFRHLAYSAVAVVCLALGLGSEQRAFGWANAAWWIPDLIVGLTFLYTGASTWTDLRPTGALLTATGLTWFAGNLTPLALFWHRGPLTPDLGPRRRRSALASGDHWYRHRLRGCHASVVAQRPCHGSAGCVPCGIGTSRAPHTAARCWSTNLGRLVRRGGAEHRPSRWRRRTHARPGTVDCGTRAVGVRVCAYRYA